MSTIFRKLQKFYILPYSAFCVFSMILTINYGFFPPKNHLMIGLYYDDVDFVLCEVGTIPYVT